jgi:hypothetical protein
VNRMRSISRMLYDVQKASVLFVVISIGKFEASLASATRSVMTS